MRTGDETRGRFDKKTEANTSRKYKDGVFTDLFNSKEKIVELYNALHGTNYGEDAQVQIITLENVLFTRLKNDLAFVFNNRFIILAEHQSTISENLPLRMFLYLAREYEKIVDQTTLYRKNIVKIPTPELIVFYNGEEDFPERKKLFLSDAYKESSASLELKVEVYNINYNKCEVLKNSKTLSDYSYFIHQIRLMMHSGKSRDEAINIAVKQCIEQDILRDYLKNRGSEVYNMLSLEFDMDEALRIQGEEAREEGLKAGLKEGLEKGLEEGLEKGLEEGLEKGLEEGLEKGLEKGLEEGLKKGMKEGMEKGRINFAIRMFQKGNLDKETCARELLMTTEEFEHLLKNNGTEQK